MIKKPTNRSLALAALGMSAVLLAGACGSSKSSSSATTSSGGAATTSGSGSATTTGGSGGSASGSPFVIGSISDVTGAEASSLGTSEKAVQAWADWTNDNGGINGHKVKLISEDTGFNPSTALSEVKQMVEQDHIIALIADQSSFDATFVPYLQQHGIPLVGGGLFQQASWTNPDYFPQGATTLPQNYNLVHLGPSHGKNKLALLYCAESPACAQSVPLYKSLTASLGVSLVYTASVSASSPDFTAPCLAAKNAGANYMSIGDASSVVIRVATSCQQQGYSPLQVSTDGTVTNAWATSPAMQGAIMVQQNAPFSDTSNPAIQTMLTALNKYEPGVTTSQSWGENDVFSWASGQLFTAAAKAANLGDNATSAQVIQGLYALKGDTLGGLAPPLTYTNTGKGHQVYCSFVMGVANNKFTTPQGSTLSCAPTAVINPIVAASGG
jgi:branched-chain amino acid transport system substrate-binding protein